MEQMQTYSEIIPVHIKHHIDDYITNRTPPGGFLYAVLTNDLVSAVTRADMENKRNLPEIVGYLYNACPMKAWGTEEKVLAWLNHRE